MKFGKLFNKKQQQAPTKLDEKERIHMMIKQKIDEFNLMASNREANIRALTEEARAKLESDDRDSVKRLLFKIKRFEIYQKILKETIDKLEEKK